MANNIGTHAAKLIEGAHQITWALQGLGRLGTDLGVSHDPKDFYNLVEVLTGIQSDRIEELTDYLTKEVLPIVTHINKPALPNI